MHRLLSLPIRQKMGLRTTFIYNSTYRWTGAILSQMTNPLARLFVPSHSQAIYMPTNFQPQR